MQFRHRCTLSQHTSFALPMHTERFARLSTALLHKRETGKSHAQNWLAATHAQVVWTAQGQNVHNLHLVVSMWVEPPAVFLLNPDSGIKRMLLAVPHRVCVWIVQCRGGPMLPSGSGGASLATLCRTLDEYKRQ